MSQTVIRGTQILNNTVQRQDLDTSTVGQAVVTKLVQGSGITLSSTGADSGTGDVTVTSPDVVSTDAGNIATLGTDNHILVPQSQIWSVRLRSINILGNPTFECCQRNCSATLTNPASGTFIEDRWSVFRAGTHAGNWGRSSALEQVVVPGTNFVITIAFIRFTLTTQQASLGVTDFLSLNQIVEGPLLRPLIGDVHSAQVLVRSSIAGLKFGVGLRDPGNTRSLTKLCTTSGTANTWTLIQMPNMPVFPSAGNFQLVPGQAGYQFVFCLAAGATYTAAANDTFQTGLFVGALGQDSFVSKPVNSTFDIGLAQHQPGALSETPIDCSFGQNLDGDMGCLRYFAKSYPYGTKPATASVSAGLKSANTSTNVTSSALGNVAFPKTMAKTPTVNAYAYDGTLNAVSVVGGGNLGVTSAANPGDAGFDGVNFASAQTANYIVQYHYSADTGW